MLSPCYVSDTLNILHFTYIVFPAEVPLTVKESYIP